MLTDDSKSKLVANVYKQQALSTSSPAARSFQGNLVVLDSVAGAKSRITPVGSVGDDANARDAKNGVLKMHCVPESKAIVQHLVHDQAWDVLSQPLVVGPSKSTVSIRLLPVRDNPDNGSTIGSIRQSL